MSSMKCLRASMVGGRLGRELVRPVLELVLVPADEAGRPMPGGLKDGGWRLELQLDGVEGGQGGRRINTDRLCWLYSVAVDVVPTNESGRRGRQGFRLVWSYVGSYVHEAGPEETDTRSNST